MARDIIEYGEQTICYTLDGKNCYDQNTSLSITKANELVELDGGIELLRTKSTRLPNAFYLHGEKLKFNVIYTTPNTRGLAEKAAEKYKAALIELKNETCTSGR